jgi:hypothetical protein
VSTSGTTSFDLDLVEAIEEAWERCGAESRTGWDLKTARRSINLMFAEWANRGVNLWTIDSGTINLVPGTATYTLPADTVDVIEHVIRTGASTAATQADLTISRISVSTYATIPNKLVQARPIQLWVQRLGTPQVTVWPVPDAAQTYQLIYWRLRRIQDAGSGVNTMDLPFRFLPAFVAGLAYYLAMKVPGGMDRLQVLQQQYDAAWSTATDEDRDRAAVRFVPRVGYVR